jgi:hypothetical protein
MARSPSESPRKGWVEAAEQRLTAVQLAALAVRVAIDVVSNSQSPADVLADASDPLLASVADLLDWLAHAAVPTGLEQAAAELQAAAGVYRNAAVVYPGLSDPSEVSHAARARACDAMLQQGEHHVAMFRSSLP